MVNGRDFAEFFAHLNQVADDNDLRRITPNYIHRLNNGYLRDPRRLVKILLAMGQDPTDFVAEQRVYADNLEAKRERAVDMHRLQPHHKTIIAAKVLKLKLAANADVEVLCCPEDKAMNPTLKRKGFVWSELRNTWRKTEKRDDAVRHAIELAESGLECKVRAI